MKRVKGLPEQLDSQVRAQQLRKIVKRQASKAMRRAAKQDIENAPMKIHYRGYVS